MLTIGLTGQSGAGKGTVAKILLCYEGVKCIDTDLTARDVVKKGKPALCELCEYFGDEILDADGNLNRRKLARIAFSDKEKHEALNRITHFHIMKEIKQWLSDMEKEGAKIAIIDAPLLFESGADNLCDITIGVTAPYETRLERIMKRDSIDENNARIRLDSQPKDNFFKEKCTYMLYNDKDEEHLKTDAKKLLCEILNNNSDTER